MRPLLNINGCQTNTGVIRIYTIIMVALRFGAFCIKIRSNSKMLQQRFRKISEL